MFSAMDRPNTTNTGHRRIYTSTPCLQVHSGLHECIRSWKGCVGSIRVNTLKIICIVLVSWGMGFGAYQLDAVATFRHTYLSHVFQREVIPGKPSGMKDAKSPIEATMRMSKEANYLTKIRRHINETAASILRERLISNGFVSAEILQIYLHKSTRKNRFSVSFPSKSKYEKRQDGSPWLPEADTCAVIGNGGILKGSDCGEEINAHDLVFRSNMARIDGFIQDVGNKTNLMSINWQETVSSISCLRIRRCRDRLLRYIDVYLKGSIIWLSKLHGSYKTDRDYKIFVSQLGKYRKSLIYGYPRRYLSLPVHRFWNTTRIPSSGLFLHAVASHVCKKISLYGFYPFNSTESGRQLPYHYYQNVTFVNKHNMPEEYSELIKLNQTGAIRLVTRNCT